MRVLHPEDLGEVVHLDILFHPPVECGVLVVVLMTRHVSRRPSNRAGGDHLPKSTEQVKVRIGRFQGAGVEGLVESQHTIAANFDTAKLNVGPGADQIHDENNSKEASKLATVGTLVIRVTWDEVHAED